MILRLLDSLTDFLFKVDRIQQENQRMKLELDAFQKKFNDLEQFAKSIGKSTAVQERVSFFFHDSFRRMITIQKLVDGVA